MMNWMLSGLFVLICWGAQWTGLVFPPPSSASPPPAFACDLIVDAGPDTNVCDPGGVLTLQGSIIGNAVYYQWSPSSGLNNPFILNPIANITGPITYTLTAYGNDPDNPNLVVNGDFSGGNIGFSSDYTYVVDIPNVQNEMNPEGTYAVVNNPNLVHAGFSACSDHTGGNGNMMVINGAANLLDIWCQTITINEDSWYNVSAWVASMNPASPAELQFSINGSPIGQIINADPTPCNWIPFNATWNSGSSTTAEICILNLNTALGGNDFALDDISMVELCSVEDEVEITLYEEEAPEPDIAGPAFLCEGETGTYTASFPAEPEINSYQWSIPSGAVLLSGQGTPEVTILWEDAQQGEICLEIETRCDMNEGCFEVTVGTFPVFPLISGPTSMCPGDIATFYTAEVDPNDTYEWIVPAELNIVSGEGTNEIEVEWAQPGEAEICLEVTNACGTTDNCTIVNLWPAYLTLMDTIICSGSTVEINGTTYGNGLFSGVETFTSVNGCDSIVEVEISEATVLTFLFTSYLCPGDSIYLEGAYQTQGGIYTDNYLTSSGCDSIVITDVILSPSDTTWIMLGSCNPLDTGTFIITINQGNCDSTAITEITLLPTDTTLINLSSCFPADTGVVIQLLSNQFGCDSLIVTSTALLHTDTTALFLSTCDPAGVGVTQQTLTNIVGCDSLVITTVSFLLSDTTLLTDYACVIADTGTTSTLLVNSMGCDSLVIVQTLYGGSDTTYLFFNTCSAADSGYIISNLTNQYGCDSIVSAYTTLLPSDTTYLSASSCEPQDTGVVMQHYTNTYGCDSLVIVTITLDPPDLCSISSFIAVVQPLCFGDTGIVTVSATTGLSPFTVQWRHASLALNGMNAINSSPGTIAIELVTPGTYYFETTSANGLSILDTIQIDNIAPLSVTATTQTDMFGFNIPCAGDASGVAIATLTGNGTPPHLYNWSEGSATTHINQLSPGTYSVTVTDSHGCTSSSSITLTEPLPMQYTITSDDINCFGQQNGSVAISSIQGGVAPWTSALDQGSFQNTLAYTGLGAGAHELVISDQNGCTQQENFIITEPQDWYIDLGPDTVVAFGQPYTLAIEVIGKPYGMLQVSWSDDQCANCLLRPLKSTSAITYEAIVTDENGCEHADEIKIDVFIDRNLYIPNVFSPNDDQVNDYFTISSASGIKMIEELTIYDRWGTFVFQQFNFLPDDPTYSWDGTSRGKPLNPGVYVYKLVARYIDDKPIVKFGDVTLIR